MDIKNIFSQFLLNFKVLKLIIVISSKQILSSLFFVFLLWKEATHNDIQQSVLNNNDAQDNSSTHQSHYTFTPLHIKIYSSNRNN